MAIKIYKPTTAGRRKMSTTDFSLLTKGVRPSKSLLWSKGKSGGRNQHGHITVRHVGGGSRKKIRILDTKRDKFNIPGKIMSLEYDPGRSAFIAGISYRDGEKRYAIAAHDAKVGQELISSKNKVEVMSGNRTSLKHIPVGTPVHDVEIEPGKGGQIAKSAGNFATIMAVEGGYASLKLPSGEIRKVSEDCTATIGQVSNIDHNNVRIGKAGRMRWKGVRPTVRGKAMNPVDHPHGGGEGRNPIGLKYPKTPWGKHALGVKTRKKHKSSDKFIIQRRKK